ncbi:MAG: hypothetical protein IKI45_09685 [Oscillospiraceae bacterium]|nr:hypothetical protein [Oscillospiraceae bacterium]
MANKNPSFNKRVPVSKPYLVTRNQALRLSPSNFTQFMKESTVYGVIVDMPMAPTVITTLACYINGAANLYFSNGNDYSGAAQRYPGVVQATRIFVTNAARFVTEENRARTLELPNSRSHYAYILTTKGIHRIEINPLQGQQTPAERAFLLMYQRVMGELHTAQLKDKAAGAQLTETLVATK